MDDTSNSSGADCPALPHPPAARRRRDWRCGGAAFRFPLIDGYLGWLYLDKRSYGTDPSGDHTGLDIWPPVRDAQADVYPLANGVLKEVNRARHSFEVYYRDQGVTSYMAHVVLNDGLGNDDSVHADQPLGRLLLQPGNTHLHFSLRHSRDWSHYDDQQGPNRKVNPGPMLAEDPSDWFNANLSDPAGAATPSYHDYPYFRRPYSDFCRAGTR